MFCSKCGQKLNEGVIFCPKCGNKINVDSNNEVPQNQPKKQNRKNILFTMLYITIGLIIILLSIQVFNNFLNINTPSNVVKMFYKSMADRDIETFKKCLSPDDLNFLNSSFGEQGGTLFLDAFLGAFHEISPEGFSSLRNIRILSENISGNKATVTVLWSICAFVQMWLGMRLKYKTLRIISLSLLGLVLCKLFVYDLSSVSQGAKIIAFVVLGVVLLVLSFLYQKLKKILFEEE